VEVLTVCDVKPKQLEKALKEARGRGAESCEGTPYYEEVLERDDIDAVLVSTPDHWHAAIAIAAMRTGKDVYVEKPMTLTVEEGKAMRDAERAYRRIVQVGSQQRSDPNFRKAAEIVRNGLIGEIKEVHTGIGSFPEPFLKEPEPVPQGFDYDRWLGPAPFEDYFEERVQGVYSGGWRCFWDYGSRKLGDWGAHHFDIIQWALGMDDSGPVQFLPESSGEVEYDTFVYENGIRVGVNSGKTEGFMIRFVGTEGEAMATRREAGVVTKPSYLAKQPLPSSAERLYFSNDHHRNWLDCVKSRKSAICPASVGHRTGSICQLMGIAKRLGRPLKWDPASETIIDDPAANGQLSRPRRAGYELPV
jgi:predicted dehydrogenase